MPKYRLTKDIIIPKGTILYNGPYKSTYFSVHVEAVLEHGKDTASHWRIDLDDAASEGLVERIDD